MKKLDITKLPSKKNALNKSGKISKNKTDSESPNFVINNKGFKASQPSYVIKTNSSISTQSLSKQIPIKATNHPPNKSRFIGNIPSFFLPSHFNLILGYIDLSNIAQLRILNRKWNDIATDYLKK